jgi:hypothetical protein
VESSYFCYLGPHAKCQNPRGPQIFVVDANPNILATLEPLKNVRTLGQRLRGEKKRREKEKRKQIAVKSGPIVSWSACKPLGAQTLFVTYLKLYITNMNNTHNA